MAIERSIETPTHGRILCSGDAKIYTTLIIGFHGYTETAEIQLQRLQAMKLSDTALCSVQGLHCFYKQNTIIAASWMCSQNRDVHIKDNIRYVNNVIDALSQQWRWSRLVFAGFSQGAAMAYRAAVLCRHRSSGLLINGGDIPPDIIEKLDELPPLCIIRGQEDAYYTAEKLALDQQHLSGRNYQVHEFAGGHEWGTKANDHFSNFINRLVQ